MKDFQRIIKKAEAGGFDVIKYLPAMPPKGFDEEKVLVFLLSQMHRIVFSRDFLKAFFGEEEICMRCGEHFMKPCLMVHVKLNHPELGVAWQYHAQQLVLSEDRLEYLGKHLKGDSDAL